MNTSYDKRIVFVTIQRDHSRILIERKRSMPYDITLSLPLFIVKHNVVYLIYYMPPLIVLFFICWFIWKILRVTERSILENIQLRAY